MDKAGEDDSSLMRHIAAGDRKAFQIFLSRHLAGVVQFAGRYNASEAEDIAQDTFLRVWQKADRWREQGVSPLSWVYRIAYHLCIDALRRRRHDATPVEQAEQADPNADVARDIAAQQLLRVIAGLPERQATAITLCACHGMSNREAAGVMGITVEALESLLSRGRRELRNQLHAEGEQYLHG